MRLKKYISEATIKKTAVALAKKGYKLGTSRHDKKWNVSYLVMTPDGKAKWMTPKEILSIIESEEPLGVTVYRAKLAKELKISPKHLAFLDKDKNGYYFNVTDKKHKHFGSTRFVKRI